ncbi:M23 family metallopeptidase, partial [Candidatus Aerophobetes bacterium]|nr:M23 family metallopeptidase [Candidatus Aerophobetes bacterium]
VRSLTNFSFFDTLSRLFNMANDSAFRGKEKHLPDDNELLFPGELSLEQMEELAIQETQDSLPFADELETLAVVFSGTFRRGDTLYDFLVREGLSPQQIHLISRSLSSFVNPRNFKPGEGIELLRYGEEELMVFKYFPGGFNYYVVEETEPGVFVAREEKVPVEKILIGAKGEIKSSLYEDMRKEGLNNELILRYADIFSWEIDFLTDPRKGDYFRVIWERQVDPEGKILTEGRILVAQYSNRGKEYTAIFYEDPEGNKGYFTSEGNSLRRSFLRSPLNYTRISSNFSYRRFHPILKVHRPHLGVDYAAPTGTPVSVIGDGVVTFSGWKGGFGNYVEVRHPNGYTTSYGHLSRIASGVSKGRRVSQGQVIGYVGSTGLSTGPHLDFRIAKDGRFLNFLTLELPRAESVKSDYLEDFKIAKEVYVYHLQVLSKSSENVLVLVPESFEKEKVAFSHQFKKLPPGHFPELSPLFQARFI